jgi:hypothetical protein
VPEIPDQPRQDQKRSDQQIAELLAEVQRLAALVRTVDLCGTGFVWTDRATGKQHMLHPADVAVILRADQGTEIEKIKESAYRAGQEDAARDIERVARSTRESLVCTPPEYAGEAAYHRTRAVAFERAAVIARGDGVQPTEEQRARDEDQERDEEKEHG